MLAAAAMRAYAASLLELPAAGKACVAGEAPELHEVLADVRGSLPLTRSRLPAPQPHARGEAPVGCSATSTRTRGRRRKTVCGEKEPGQTDALETPKRSVWRARSRRKTSLTTSARTRQLGLRNATKRPTRRPSSTAEGRSARASRRAVPCNSWASSSSSRRIGGARWWRQKDPKSPLGSLSSVQCAFTSREAAPTEEASVSSRRAVYSLVVGLGFGTSPVGLLGLFAQAVCAKHVLPLFFCL